MKWMRERDLLIAQTLAFVQSVTGKAPAADKAVATPGGFEPVAPPRLADAPKSIVVAEPMPDIAAVLAVPAEPPRPTRMAALDLQQDFQSEIRSRVANFRAHQERFNKEREAYCTATLAKVRASLDERSQGK
jgi:hypothetical protein